MQGEWIRLAFVVVTVGFGVLISGIAIYRPDRRKEATGVLALMMLGLLIGSIELVAEYGLPILMASVVVGVVLMAHTRGAERVSR